MNRRRFIQSGLLLTAGHFLSSAIKVEKDAPFIMTVNGKVPAENMAFSLIHEHVLVDFIGADKIEPGRYNIDDAFTKALPYLQEAVKNGCRTIVECTPNYLGRDVALLQRLSKSTGLQIITNTGYYGAAGEKYIPAHAYTETAGQIADHWIKEYKEGIGNTGINPGFIKSGVDNYPLSAVQEKLVEATAITHLATGLTIAIHTGNGAAALEELRILKDKGVHPSAWIWVHAQNEKNRELHFKVAREGGWISFDGLSKENVQEYIQFLKEMKVAELLNKVLISHDAGWYHVGEADGGNYHGYTTVFKDLLPALSANGFTESEIRQIFTDNPAKAFAISIKNL